MGLKILSEDYRKEVLKLNLKTPPDIVLGLVDLSGAAMYAAYLDALGKDAIIKTDKASVTLKDPGNVVTDSITPRIKDLNKNLNTPNDIKTGIGNLTGSSAITQQYLAGRGLDTVINDFNVINPGDVVANSVTPRQNVLNKNLKTPNDITTGIGNLTSNAGLTQQYLAGRGLDTVIGDKSVFDPGTVDTAANIERAKLLKKNKPYNSNDPSENNSIYFDLSDGAYTYTSLLDTINKLTIINDLSVPNSTSISIDSNQTALVTLDLALQQNRYMPVEYNTFESTIISLQPDPYTTPYIDAFNSGVYTFINPEEYTPSSFLSLRTTTSPISIISGYNTDPISYFLNSSVSPILENETLLMNIAALELKFNLESRIKRAIERETIGRTYLDEATTNPLTAGNLLTGRQPLFEANYDITVPSNIIGKGAEFLASLAGVTSPISFIKDINVDYTPKCFGNTTEYDSRAKTAIGRFVADLIGKTARSDKDIWYLNHTGNGQKYALFNTIKKNKYQPDYLIDYQSGVFEVGSKVAQFFKGITGFLGVGAGKSPTGFYYIGNKTRNEDPFYLLQDADGDQVKSNEELIRVITTQVDTGTNTTSVYEEPGYDQVSQYGSLETDFVWMSSGANLRDRGLNTVYDYKTKSNKEVKVISKFKNVDKLSYTKKLSNSFRECSILYKTSQLLEKGINGFGSPIDQTLTKFYDGYDFTSRGNATIAPVKIDKLNKQGEVIGYRYLIPGLDVSGKRNEDSMYYQAELCRVWTKARPYSKITDLVRYKELIRRERNSVLDRYGNLNIHPSELNVNDGYGRADGFAAATTEAFSEKRARKYMFSLENLAWRDTAQFTDLPNCEKGFNGGRVMWFPPYDITFSDDTTANWTTHQFLGRPEPIYTYNNSERSGSLSWKIVVDHPSILNLLTQKELAKLTDGEIDEILAAFWAGCVEFDIFELARIWNQFSQSDIDYFKKVIAGLNIKTPNEPIKKKIEKITVTKQPDTIKVDSTSNQAIPVPKINGRALFFENDVPLPIDISAKKAKKDSIYNTGQIEKFSLYFEQYQKLNDGKLTGTDSVEKAKIFPGSISDTWIRYTQTIGKGSTENYFFTNDQNKVGVDKGNWYGFNEQYKDIEKDLMDAKYRQFDLGITLTAYASPLGPDTGTTTYNEGLANRRNSSVIIWLVLDVLSKVGTIYYSEDGTDEITVDNIYKEIGGATSIVVFTVYRDKGNGKRSKITISANAIAEKSSNIFEEGIKENVNQTYKKTTTGSHKYFEVLAPPVGNVSDAPIKFCCFESDAIAEKVKAKNLLPATPAAQIGSVQAKSNRPYEDVVCGSLSIESSHARRVQISVEVNAPEPTPPIPEVVPEPVDEYITPPGDVPTNDRNVTKREIAQRILNKLINECDYFELLKKDAPIVYDSLKQKLKYFSPAFHAMTPEGLNARLTFLQQCLRPGETIKKNDGDNCDANNTAFGKPPICILRIGDFYNTKIVISNLNISYEPLIWDLNPEGIGVQPMIADIQLSFKYIGGSGLRKHVDELQNALSFNYYANTDIYDERTFANNDKDERNLINLETSYFDSNTLDLIPIVAAAERIVPQDLQSDIPYGTIGIITKRRQPTTAGGAYNNDILSATTFSSDTVYQPYDIVSKDGKFYVRKADDELNITVKNTLKGSGAPVTSTSHWNEVIWRNYGEQPFRLEFSKTRPNIDEDGNATTGTTTGNSTTSDKYMSKTYFNSYEISYYELFQDLYKTYGNIVTNNFKFNTPFDNNSLLLQLALNKNYDKVLVTVNSAPLGLSGTDGSGGTDGSSGTDGASGTSSASGTDGSSSISNTGYFDDLRELGYQDDRFGTFGTASNSGTSSTSSASGTDGTSSGGKYYLYDVFKNEAAERNYVEFSEFGKLAVVNNQTLSTESIAPLKLHLYPQNNLYKIGDGKTLVSTSGTFNDATRFNPGNLNGGKINGVSAEPEVAGIFLKDFSNHRKNIDFMINGLSNEMAAKLKLDIAHFWHYDTSSKQAYNEYLKYFEVPYKAIFSDYLAGKLMDYTAIITDHIDTILTSAEENTAKFGVLLSALSVVTEGYDLRTDETKIERFEVIPNEFKIGKGEYSAETVFGYDPYQKYQKMLLATTGTTSAQLTRTITLKQVRDFVYNREHSDADKINLLSMGNGPYFFKQITKDAEFKKLVPSGYTQDNYLVESNAIKNNLIITGSTETQSLMPNFLLGANGITLNTIYDKAGGVGETTVKSIQLVDPVPGTYSDYYNMTYTFEKINYEVFDFSNKMLDIMVNDNFLSKKFDLDIIYSSENDEFARQLLALDPKAIDLFYYGANKNTLLNTPISHYIVSTSSALGTTTESYLTEINKFIGYEVIINQILIDDLGKKDKNYLVSLVGKKIELSGLLDMFFIGFFATLDDNDKENILKLIKAADKPKKGVTSGSTRQINSRYRKIEKTLTKVFKAIYKYRDDASKKTTALNTDYTKNIKKVNDSVVKIITETNSGETILDNPMFFETNLTRGNEVDYTLVLKDTVDVKKSVLNNYKIFTKYRNVFNIINQSEVPEVVEQATETELSKYEKGE